MHDIIALLAMDMRNPCIDLESALVRYRSKPAEVIQAQAITTAGAVTRERKRALAMKATKADRSAVASTECRAVSQSRSTDRWYSWCRLGRSSVPNKLQAFHVANSLLGIDLLQRWTNESNSIV